MTTITQQTHKAPAGFQNELFRLLPQVIFSSHKGTYVRGKSVSILVDPIRNEAEETFDVGMTIFPLDDASIDLTGLSIVVTGQADSDPKVRPFRRGTANRRGNLTLKDLPNGMYRALSAKSVIAPTESLPAFKLAANCTTTPPFPLFLEYTSEQETEVNSDEATPEAATKAKITCILRETPQGELLLYFEVSSVEYEELRVGYAIVDPDSEQTVSIEQEGHTITLAGELLLQRESSGCFSAEISLGFFLRLPEHRMLRAWLIPLSSQQ